MSDITVVVFNGHSKILSRKQLFFRNKTMKPCPIIGYENFVFDADFIKKLLTGFIITTT